MTSCTGISFAEEATSIFADILICNYSLGLGLTELAGTRSIVIDTGKRNISMLLVSTNQPAPICKSFKTGSRKLIVRIRQNGTSWYRYLLNFSIHLLSLPGKSKVVTKKKIFNRVVEPEHYSKLET
jgi:hypothetical protein